jgi:hypothetical protein
VGGAVGAGTVCAGVCCGTEDGICVPNAGGGGGIGREGGGGGTYDGGGDGSRSPESSGALTICDCGASPPVWRIDSRSEVMLRTPTCCSVGGGGGGILDGWGGYGCPPAA